MNHKRTRGAMMEVLLHYSKVGGCCGTSLSTFPDASTSLCARLGSLLLAGISAVAVRSEQTHSELVNESCTLVEEHACHTYAAAHLLSALRARRAW